MEKYITYNHNNFDNIGLELYKFSITLSIAINTNKTLVLFNNEYMSIIDTFIKYKYKSINIKEFNELNFKYVSYKDIIDDNNIYITYTDKDELKLEDINDNTRKILSILLSSNELYNKFVYNKINEIMNYFNDYNINNYVCIYINKDKYDINYYKNVYNNYFKMNKLIIFTDDIDESCINKNEINKEQIIIEMNNNKYSNFILLSMFPNMIIGDYKINYISYFSAYMGNRNKKIVINKEIKIDNWIIYHDENIQNT